MTGFWKFGFFLALAITVDWITWPARSMSTWGRSTVVRLILFISRTPQNNTWWTNHERYLHGVTSYTYKKVTLTRAVITREYANRVRPGLIKSWLNILQGSLGGLKDLVSVQVIPSSHWKGSLNDPHCCSKTVVHVSAGGVVYIMGWVGYSKFFLLASCSFSSNIALFERFYQILDAVCHHVQNTSKYVTTKTRLLSILISTLFSGVWYMMEYCARCLIEGL